MRYQIAIDCTDPHGLVRFWADAMELEVEDHHDQIESLAAQGVVPADEYIEIDGRLAWRTGAACRSADGTTRLLFQVVPEPKTVKNRVHLDLDVGPEAREATVQRLLDLGAKSLGTGSQGPHEWVVLADPEGNEFCVG